MTAEPGALLIVLADDHVVVRAGILAELAHSAPRTRVVILTMDADPAMARRALGGGASAYVLKEAADADLVDAIRRAAAGGSYLDPALGALVAAAPPAAREQEEV